MSSVIRRDRNVLRVFWLVRKIQTKPRGQRERSYRESLKEAVWIWGS